MNAARADEPSPVADLLAHANRAQRAVAARAPIAPRTIQLPGMPEATAEARRGVLAAAWRAQVPLEFQSARLADFDDAPTVRAMLAAWGRQSEGQNLVITGPIGAGKTHAGFAAARAPFGEGSKLAFWPSTQLLRAVNWTHDDSDAVMDRCCTVDILFIDDLGVERPSDWATEQWYTIINQRWMDSLATIVTTNLEPPDLAEHLGAGGRTYSRLADTAMGVRLSGADRRRSNPDGD